MVEFALCAIVFLVLLFGIMDWALALYQYQTIVWRASDGARWAAAHNAGDSTGIQNMVRCGTTSSCTAATSFFVGGTIEPILVTTTDQVDPTKTVGPVTRHYVKVTVSGYQITHFIPGFSGTFTARTVVVQQPMECQATDGNCTYTPPT